jgi:hypothetical protein
MDPDGSEHDARPAPLLAAVHRQVCSPVDLTQACNYTAQAGSSRHTLLQECPASVPTTLKSIQRHDGATSRVLPPPPRRNRCCTTELHYSTSTKLVHQAWSTSTSTSTKLGLRRMVGMYCQVTQLPPALLLLLCRPP